MAISLIDAIEAADEIVTGYSLTDEHIDAINVLLDENKELRTASRRLSNERDGLKAELAAARERAESAEADNALLFDYWPRQRWDGTLIPGDLKMSGKQTWCIRTPAGIKGPFATPIDAIRFYLAQQANAAAGIEGPRT
jgi:hypothetical protein